MNEVPISNVYYQTLKKSIEISGFRVYLVQTIKNTNILAFSKNNVMLKKTMGNTFKKRRYIVNSSTKSYKKCKRLKKSKHYGTPSRNSENYKNISNDPKVYIYKGVNDNNKTVLLSDQFIFKPAIPINETNYPLDSTDKQEYSASELKVHTILSYSFTDPPNENCTNFPSVSRIIEETISDKSKHVLANWQKKMITDLGDDGFHNHSEGMKSSLISLSHYNID